MMRVTVEIHPGGSSADARQIASIDFENISDLASVSDYHVVAKLEDRSPFRTVLRGHPRASGWMPLVQRALAVIWPSANDGKDANRQRPAKAVTLAEQRVEWQRQFDAGERLCVGCGKATADTYGGFCATCDAIEPQDDVEPGPTTEEIARLDRAMATVRRLASDTELLGADDRAALSCVLAALVAQTLARSVSEGCSETPRAQRHERGCISRASDSCVYLRDGTKVVMRREPLVNGRVYLEVVEQAVISTASTDEKGEGSR